MVPAPSTEVSDTSPPWASTTSRTRARPSPSPPMPDAAALRAAVVLRYGYDLPYAQIADALGSSEDAARAAASSGVRRLRRNV